MDPLTHHEFKERATLNMKMDHLRALLTDRCELETHIKHETRVVDSLKARLQEEHAHNTVVVNEGNTLAFTRSLNDVVAVSFDVMHAVIRLNQSKSRLAWVESSIRDEMAAVARVAPIDIVVDAGSWITATDGVCEPRDHVIVPDDEGSPPICCTDAPPGSAAPVSPVASAPFDCV
jgi:hypothetical protein